MRARKRPRRASADVVLRRNGTSNRGGGSPQDDHEFRRSSSSWDLDKDGYVQVELAEIREKVQCLICRGIIRNTRALKECLHRFCQDCIAIYMLLGGNKCPACHAHCGSNSLRADPRYDALIEAFYPDVGKSTMVCSFHLLSPEDAMRSKPLDTPIIPSVDSQNQLEGTTNVGVKTNSPFPRKTRKTEDQSSPGALSKSSRNTPAVGASKKHSTALPTVKKQKDERSTMTKCRGLVLALASASSPIMELGRGTAVPQSLSTDVLGALVGIDDILVDKEEMSNAQIFGSADQDTVQAIDITTITDTIVDTNSTQEIITSMSITASDIPTDDHDHPQRMRNRRQDDQPAISDSLMGSDTRSPPPLTAADYAPPSADSASGDEPVETVLAGSAIAEGLARTSVNPYDPTSAAMSELAAIPSSLSPPVQLGRRVLTSTIRGSSKEVNKELISLTDQYQALSDNDARLLEEIVGLKAQLAEAEHRVTINRLRMTQVWQAIKEFRDRETFKPWSSRLDHQYSVKAQYLSGLMMAFRSSIEKFVDTL